MPKNLATRIGPNHLVNRNRDARRDDIADATVAPLTRKRSDCAVASRTTVEPAERTGSVNQRFGPDDSVRLACVVTGSCLPVQPGKEGTSRAVENASVGAPLRRRL